MALQNRRKNTGQESLFTDKKYSGRLNDADKNLIIEAFIKEHINTISRLVELTGYTKSQVSKTIDDYLCKKGPNKKIVFSETPYCDPKQLAKKLYEDKEQWKRYGEADFVYYAEAVGIFSEKNPGLKRSVRGWLATVRQFMNTDMGSGRFKKRPVKEAVRQAGKHHNF